MDIGDRIKIVLSDSNLKKVEFAQKLNIDQSYVTRLVSGEKKPSIRLINDICEKFDVNKEWLLNNVGDPYKKRSRNQEIAAFMNSVMSESDESIKKRLVNVLAKLDARDWETLAKIAEALTVKEDD